MSTKFNNYYKLNKIVTVSMFTHSSYLLQPLDVKLYSPLKPAYNHQINLFIQTSINHITKTKFFITYLAAHNAIFTKKNIKTKFKNIGILLWDPDSIVSKLNVHFHTPTFPSSHSSFGYYWELQTPKTKKQTHSQFHLIKNCIFTHQKNSFTPILETVNQLAKNVQLMALEFIIIRNEIHTLQDANMALAKHQKTKRTCLQKRGTFNQKDSKILLKKEKKRKRPALVDGENADPLKQNKITLQ